MSKKEFESSEEKVRADEEDPLGSTEQLVLPESPPGVDRRTFLMRSAVIGAAAVMTGCATSTEERTAKAAKETAQKTAAVPTPPPLSPDLNVVKKAKGPVMTMVDEFYKVGPGPSSSHTIGPMRITYDFYQRCSKLPADQLSQATASRSTCSGASAPPARGTARSAPRLQGWSGKSRQPSIPCFSTL